MKKFLSGVLAATLVFSLAISALAISGRMTIEVDPINIQVNGETFIPADVNGKEVPVFAYNGTTYAPLRALAEAYGLEVGYDAATNMATVNDPGAQQPATPDTTAKADYSDWSAEDEAAYQEFKKMWEVKVIAIGEEGQDVKATYISSEPFSKWRDKQADIEPFFVRLAFEQYPGALNQYTAFFDAEHAKREDKVGGSAWVQINNGVSEFWDVSLTDWP